MRVFAVLAVFLVAIPLLAADPRPAELRGKLIQPDSGAIVVETASGTVEVSAEKDAAAVLNDPRLKPYEVVLRGRFKDATHFTLNPFFTSPILALRDGRAVHVSYWCPVCSIRSYTPGLCVCCRNETHLDFNWDDTRTDNNAAK